MPTIYKLETVQEAVGKAVLHEQQSGTQRNLTGRQCSICFMSFETYKAYPKQTCGLCRWERAKADGCTFEQYLSRNAHKDRAEKPTEEEFYTKGISRGIFLQRRKERTMKAAGVTFTRILSERIKPFLHLLDS